MPDYYAHSKKGETTSEQNIDPAIGEGVTVICRTGRPTERSCVCVCLRISR
jgi:hypothetical protein